MSENYYVRIRGEVKGPVSRSEMVSQIRKKRIGRHHEVSTDAVTWMRAVDVPDLFEPVVMQREQGAPAEDRSEDSDSRGEGSAKSKRQESVSGADWFYAKGKNRLGPVSESDLRTMLLTGKLAAADLVWNESLDDWLPIAQAPQFISLAPANYSNSSDQSEKVSGTSNGTILTSSLFSLQFACISLLCAPLVAMLTAVIMDSPGFSRTNAGAGMLRMLMIAGVFGALPVFSAIAGILTGHHSLRIHARTLGQYQGSGYALSALIVCYTVLVVTLITLFVFLIVIGVKSA